MKDYSGLLPYATDVQRRYIEAVIEYKGVRPAAIALDVCNTTIYRSLDALERRVSLAGHLPTDEMTAGVPDPFFVKGTSTMYDSDGAMKLRWVKTAVDYEHVAALQKEFVKELCEGIAPRAPLVSRPLAAKEDLMVAYPIGDHHFGMLAWSKETGDHYDTKIAKQLLDDAIDNLVSSSPPAQLGVIVNLGDLLHIDNRTNRTPASGHILDVDSRYARIIRFAAYGMCSTVERALEKHEVVKVVNVAGNHDPDSASWISLVMEAYFRNSPRVIVETSPAKILFHKFGMNMLAFTHGDTMKLPMIPGIMASYEPKMWGETSYRVCYTGHVHHSQQMAMKENHGAKVESFGVLPPLDAYGASMGFKAERTMSAICYHRDGGERSRTTYRVHPGVDWHSQV